MRPRWGKANKGEMSQQERRDDGRRQIDIFYELPASPEGTYQYTREDGTAVHGDADGTAVHGDASGKWTLDENGEFEDIVIFARPRAYSATCWRRRLVETPRRTKQIDRREHPTLLRSR